MRRITLDEVAKILFSGAELTLGANEIKEVEDCHLCWAGAFTRVTDCADTRMQMRRLDRVREGMLSKVWKMLPRSCGKKRRRYKGKPFSYCGFLENAARRRVSGGDW